MGADYTIWKPKTKERFLLWTGAWTEILDLEDCKLTKLTTSLDYIVSKMEYYHFSDANRKAWAILDFCGDDEIVLTNDCGEEYFSEEDIFYGIKDTYKIVGDITR
jgi:hypothetical protein